MAARNTNIYDGALIQFYSTDNTQSAYIQLSGSDVLKLGGCSVVIDSLSLNGSGSTGTITNAIWNGNAISIAYGGTGLTSIPSGSLIYASASNTMATLAPANNEGMLLVSSATNPSMPQWSYTIGKTGQDIVIAGNLVVNGGTTTINTAQLTVSDNVITLNSGATGTPSLNAGIEITRGALVKSTILWVETGSNATSYWAAGLAGSEDAIVLATKSQVLTNKTYNGLGLTANTTGFSITGGSTTVKTFTLDADLTASRVISVSGTSNRISVSGTTTLATGGSISTVDIASTYVGQASITTLGTITTGTWSGDTIAVNKGGTGFNSYAIGDILFASATTAMAKLAGVATGNVLISGGVGAAPSYGKVTLTTHVSGILPIANGGTNANTIGGAGTNVYSTGTALAYSAVGVSGRALVSGGTGAPTWFSPTAGNVIFAGSSGELSNGDLIWDDSGKVLTLKYDTNNYATLTAGSGGTLILHADSGSGGSIQIFNSNITQSRALIPGKTLSVDLGSLQKKWNTIYTSELQAETLVAQDTFSTIGGRILISNSSSLIADVSSLATSIDVKHKSFGNGDIILLEANLTTEFMQIASSATPITGGYRYTVVRDLDKTGVNSWNAGDSIVNTGQAGTGFIDIYSYSGTGVDLFDYVYNYNNANTTFSQNYNSNTSWSPFADGANTEVGDALYFGITLTSPTDQWNNIYLNLTTAAVYTATLVWEYFNGSAWVSFVPLVSSVKPDGTQGSAGLFKDAGWYSIEWTSGSLTNWATNTINGQAAKWVRCRISAFTSWATLPVTSNKHRAYFRMRKVGPTIVGNVRQSSTFNDWVEYWGIGNLNGTFGYGGDIYGAAFGKYAATGSTYITIDSTNGFRILNGNATIGQWDMDGALTVGTVASGKTNLRIDSSGNLTINNNTTTRIALNSDGSGSLADGNISWTNTGIASISGWTVQNGYLAKDTGTAGTSSGMAPTDYPFFAGQTYANRASAPFRVTPAGAVTAANMNISGGSLSVGTSPNWFKVDSSGNVWSGNATLAGAQGATFAVTNSGALYAITAYLGGSTNGWQVSAGKIVALGSGVITTDSASNRGLELSNTALKGWNSSSVQTLELNTDGSGWFGLSGAKAIMWNNAGAVTIGGYTVNATSQTSTNIGIHAAAYSEGAEILLGHATLYTSAKIGLKADGSGKLASGNISWDTSGSTTLGGTLSVSGTATLSGTIQTSAAANTGIKLNTSAITFYSGTVATGSIGTDGSGWLGGSSSNKVMSWTSGGVTTIGGWTATDTKLWGGSGSNFVGIQKYVSSASDIIYFAGATNNAGASAVFKVTADGAIYSSSATLAGTLTVSGVATLSGTIQTASSGARVVIDSTGINGYDATTQRYDFSNDGSGWIGSSNFITWTTAGTLKVGNWTVSGSALSGSGINLTSSTDASIAIGATPPTGVASGTGVWMDKTGIYGIVGNAAKFSLETATGLLTTINANIGGWLVNSNTIYKDLVSLYAATNTSYFKVGNATSYDQASTSGIWIGQTDASNYRISVKSGNSKMLWTGSQFEVYGNNTLVFGTTATGATLGGWNVDSSSIKSTTNLLTLSSGTSPYIGLGITSYSSNNGIWFGYDTSTWKLSIKNLSGAQYLLFDGTNISWAGVNTSLTSAGAFTASSATITGDITANTGKIGGATGWAIGANELSTSSVTNKIRAVSTAILSNDTGFILQGNGTFRAGTVSGGVLSKGLYWDGANITVKGTNFELSSSGNLWATSGGFAGTVGAPKISLTSEGLAVLSDGIERAFMGVRGSVGGDGFRTPIPTAQTITGNLAASSFGSWTQQTGGQAVSNTVNASAQAVQNITANTSYTVGWSEFVSPANTVNTNSTYTYKFTFAGYSGNTTYVGFQASATIQQSIASVWTDVRTMNIGNASGTPNSYSISYANTSGSGDIRLRISMNVIPNLVTGSNITQSFYGVTLEASNYFVDLTDKGIYVYNSPDNYIKFGNGYADFIGQTVTFTNLNVLSSLQIVGSLTVTGGVTVTGAQSMSSPLQVLNTNAIIPAGSPNVYGIEIDNGFGGANSGNATGIFYKASDNRWGIGSRAHVNVGTQLNTPALDPIVTTQSADALTGKTSYNGLVITANTGVITTGTWNGTVIGRNYIGAGTSNHVLINDAGGSLSSESQLAISRGGTGQSTALAAFDALAPSTTLGDIMYFGASSTTRLAGNTTTTKMFLAQTGTGSVSAAPIWSAIAKADVGLGSVENTAISTWAGSSNITTVGTIGSGTWQGNAIANTYISTITTAGKVSGSAINSGTISGSTVINTTGTITAASFSTSTGTVGTVHMVEYVAPVGGLAQAASLDISIAPCSPTGKSYVVGSNKLLVYVDGILQRKDTNSSAYDKDYWEIDSTHIRFNYDIAQGGIIQFVILGW